MYLYRNIGYLVHPKIVSKLPPDPVIADIGTGTGRFLLQLADFYPTAELHGFDISPALFPSPEELPDNVYLDTMDIKQPPQSSVRDKYDLIHVRLLAAGIAPAEWEPAVRNIIKLLKPGGAIQWTECNWAGVQHLRGGTHSSIRSARFMGIQFKEGLKDKFSHGWNVLPKIFCDAGLIDVDEDVVSSDRVVETRKALTENGMQAIFAWARLVSSRSVEGSLPMDELRKLEIEAYKDIENGCYVRFNVHVIIGFDQSC